MFKDEPYIFCYVMIMMLAFLSKWLWF